MVCSKCGGSVGELKSGISKKNNRPWAGWKCQCGEMTFMHAGKTTAPANNTFVSPQEMAVRYNGNGNVNGTAVENAEIFPPKPAVDMKNYMMAESYCKDLYIEIFKFAQGDLKVIDQAFDSAIVRIKAGASSLVNQ